MFNLTKLAFAEAKGSGGNGGGAFGMLIPILAMIVIFYFLLIRPSQKKEKERKKMIESIQKGDKVITISGIYGVVTNIREEENIVVLKIAEKTNVEFSKTSIQSKIS